MTPPVSELAHPVRLDRIGSAPIRVTLKPDASIRKALAERFGLESIESLLAELVVSRRRSNGWIEVSGTVSASVVQTCVATSEPVAATLETEILELFDDSGDVGPDEVDLDPMADTPEPIAARTLDVGEIAAQAFGLALNPYPRASDAPSDETTVTGPTDAASGNLPFAKLAVLKGLDVKKR